MLPNLSCIFSFFSVSPVQVFRNYGGKFPRSRHANAKLTKRQQHRSFSPRLRHNGGASLTSRRFWWRKIRNSVAVPLLPAVHIGGNLYNCVK